MKKLLSKFLCIALAMIMVVGMLSSAGTYAFATNDLTDNTKLVEKITTTYKEALKSYKILRGNDSFAGYCSYCVGCQLKALGITTDTYAGHGKLQFDHYKNMEKSSGGYNIKAYPASKYSLRTALEKIVSENGGSVYNILVGYEKTKSELGQTYGHVNFIYAIINNTVYYTESNSISIIRANGKQTYSAGTPIICSLDEYINLYKENVFDGVIHFYNCDYYDMNGRHNWQTTKTEDGRYNAVCSSCHSVFDYSATLKRQECGIYTLKYNDRLRAAPYQEAPSVRGGNTIEVIGYVTNPYNTSNQWGGNKWYVTNDGLYIYHENVTLKEAFPTVEGRITTNSLNINPEPKANNPKGTIPQNGVIAVYSAETANNGWLMVEYNGIKGYSSGNCIELTNTDKGSKLSIGGDNFSMIMGKAGKLPVIASSKPLTYVRVKVDGANTILSGMSNVSSCQLSDFSTLTKKLETLTVGSHKMTVAAMDISGSAITREFTITVTGAQLEPCAEPTYTVSDIAGGKRVTIQQHTAGATLYYTVNDEMNSTSSVSKSFDVDNYAEFSAYSEKGGMQKSATKEWRVDVSQLDKPEFSVQNTANGARVIISYPANSTAYYSLTGQNYQQYVLPITLLSSATVYAYTSCIGYRNSETVVNNISIIGPSAPETRLLAGNAVSAQNSAVTVGWKAISNAASYTFRAYLDGDLKETKELTETSAAFVLQETGNYSFTVSATNAIGSSSESAPVNVTSMAPCTVRFVDWDGSVLSEQTVDYGAAATEPAEPERRGYDFLYWDQNSSCLLTDATISPVYKIKSYHVTFENQNGDRIGSVQSVHFNDSVATPEIATDSGYKFVGWNVMPTSANSACRIDVQDGKYVLEGVDSDVTVKAIVEWEDAELPVSATITSAQRNDDSANSLYVVNVHLNGTPTHYTTALVRVSLKTSAGKMVMTEAHTVGLPAGTIDQTEVFTLNYSGTATIAEAVVLGFNGDYATGSAYAPAATANITVVSDYVYGPWSEWTTERPDDQAGRDIEQKTQYNYRTKQYTTSSSESMSGWTKYDTTSQWVAGNWSAWSDTAYYATTTSNYKREVQTQSVFVKKQYQYTHYYKASTGATSPIHYSGWTGPHYCGNTKGEEWIDFPLTNTGEKSNAGDYYIYSGGYCPTCGKTLKFYNEKTRDVYKTQYRYRDSNLVYTYYFYRWGNWAGWQDAAVSADSSREVATRTLYRYRDKNVPVTGQISGGEDNSGTQRSISGVLPVDEGTDLSGKVALLMVYKGKNSDPNESQLEYVGQSIIGTGNAYAFTFRTREEPTYITGDFVISLSIQGATGLVNIGTIPAEKRQHYVVFVDKDNNPIPVYDHGVKITQEIYDENHNLLYSEGQLVEEGGNAIVPDAPTVDDKRFTNWSGNTTNITDNLVLAPNYEKKNYVSVYIDWVNESVNVYEYDLGNENEAPAVQQKNGYTFLRWEEDAASGTAHVKVYFAVYEVQEFQVRFLNYDGDELTCQMVPFGGVAVPPEAPEIDHMVFLGWSTSFAWWNVSSDLEVTPIYIYEDTAETPTPEFDTFDLENPTVALIAEENATIYYTRDGSEPDVETAEVYTEPIPLEEDTRIRAIAIVPEKNVSEILEVDFEYGTEEYAGSMPELVEIGTYTVNVVPGGSTTLQLNMSNSAGLVAYLFTVECDRGVFYLDYDEETGLVTQQGNATPGGMMFCAPYEDLGYQILWFGTDGATTAGSLFSLTLKVSDEADAGSYPIRVSYSPSNTVTADDVEAVPDSMSVLFGAGSALKGDVSGDGVVTTVDIVRIARYLIDDYALTNAQLKLADVTGDGSVTAADLVRMARYIVGLAVLS